MAMNRAQAKTILARQRRSRIETYLLMAFGAIVLIWAWFDKDPPKEEFWRFLSGMLALFYGESLLTSRSARIEEAEELLDALEVAKESESDRGIRETREFMEEQGMDRSPSNAASKS